MNSTIDKKGYILTFSSYVMWGLLTIYWKQLKVLLPFEVLSMRLLFSFITIGSTLMVFKNKVFMDYLRDQKKRKVLYITSFLIMANWVIYIYAINSDQLVQASLGYYINPLISILLGMVLLKEKMSSIQKVAIGFASAGVLYMTLGYGQFPWISIALALSFGFYGYFKKTMQLDSMSSLFVEVMIGMPFAIIYTGWLVSKGLSHFGTVSTMATFLMCLSGIVSIVPLLLFAEGAKRIPLSSVGFLQYIAPTLMLLIGVLVYKESFGVKQLVSFILIWMGLGLYTFSLFKGKPILKVVEEII